MLEMLPSLTFGTHLIYLESILNSPTFCNKNSGSDGNLKSFIEEIICKVYFKTSSAVQQLSKMIASSVDGEWNMLGYSNQPIKKLCADHYQYREQSRIASR